MGRPILWGGLTVFGLLALPTNADIPLRLPIDCGPESGCHIQNYVDHDSGQGSQDFACGALTYDGHKGTDFALATGTELERDIAVLAAAPGTVRGTRDTMADALQTNDAAPDVTGRECGNGVLISHGGGWETQYCHLALGSISVEAGQRVGAGTVLGRVGLSGKTQFPHLHFSVRRNGQVVDPFDPDGEITCGAPSSDTLWSDPVTWPRSGVLDVGFADGVPEYADIKAGTADQPIHTDSSALVFFAFMFGSQPGDSLVLVIEGPEGEVFQSTVEIERAQAQLFRAGGRRAPPGGWAPGTYTGYASLIRGVSLVDELSIEITVTEP